MNKKKENIYIIWIFIECEKSKYCFFGLFNYYIEKKKENKYIILVFEEFYVLINFENMYYLVFLLMIVKYGS